MAKCLCTLAPSLTFSTRNLYSCSISHQNLCQHLYTNKHCLRCSNQLHTFVTALTHTTPLSSSSRCRTVRSVYLRTPAVLMRMMSKVRPCRTYPVQNRLGKDSPADQSLISEGTGSQAYLGTTLLKETTVSDVRSRTVLPAALSLTLVGARYLLRKSCYDHRL